MESLTYANNFLFGKTSNRNSIMLFLLYMLTLETIAFLSQTFLVLPTFMEMAETDEVVMEAMQSSMAYLIVPYISSVLIFLFQLLSISCCLYIGGLLKDDLFKVKYFDCLKISIYAHIVFILLSFISCVVKCLLKMDYDYQFYEAISLLRFFNFSDDISPLYLIPLIKINVVEVIHILLLSIMFKIRTYINYGKSLGFVSLSYGVPYLIYLLFVFFSISDFRPS